MRAVVLALIALGGRALADEATLPSPLRVSQVVAEARAHRSELAAARAAARAAAQRPIAAGALDPPSVSLSIDHVPFSLHGADASLTIEQAFPLSGIRGHRRRAAEAAADRAGAEIVRIELDVELEAAAAFWMVAEMRAMSSIVAAQHALAEQILAAATARYSANAGARSDVLRAELDVTRLAGEARAMAAETRAAEVMLNTSIARAPDASVSELDVVVDDREPPSGAEVAITARDHRPELRAGRAEVARARAEVSVMRSMGRPMAMLRTGPAYTMSDGAGWMVMVGVSIPLWRDKVRADVAEASAMTEMAEAEAEAMRRMIDGEAAAARARVVAARARYLALRDQIVPQARGAMAPTLAAYSAGQVPLVSVGDAAQVLWSTEAQLVSARSALGLAWARFRRATAQEISP